MSIAGEGYEFHNQPLTSLWRHQCISQMKAQFHNLAGDGGGGGGAPGGVESIGGEGSGVVEVMLSRLKAGWTVVLVVIVLAFAGSCIEEIAKRR